MTNQHDQTIVQNLLNNFGGQRRLIAMIGAKHFSYDKTASKFSVSFRFPGSRKANYCEIWVNLGTDELGLQLGKIRGTNFRIVKDYEEGLPNENVKRLFEQETGLYLSF